MFMPNDVFQLISKKIRVLWSNREAVIWIELESDKALPSVSSRLEFEHQMANGDLFLIDDPFIEIAMTFPVAGSKAEEVQNRAWEAIEDIVTREPEIYQRKTRGQLLTNVLSDSGATKQTVYRWLRRYWQGGKCKNALSGRFNLCGGPGKTKKLGDKKIGNSK